MDKIKQYSTYIVIVILLFIAFLMLKYNMNLATTAKQYEKIGTNISNDQQVNISKSSSSESRSRDLEEQKLKKDLDALKDTDGKFSKESLEDDQSYKVNWSSYEDAINAITEPPIIIVNNPGATKFFIFQGKDAKDVSDFETFMKKELDRKKAFINEKCENQYDYVIKSYNTPPGEKNIDPIENVKYYNLRWYICTGAKADDIYKDFDKH